MPKQRENRQINRSEDKFLSDYSEQVDQVATAVRSCDHFLLTTHENPDGDALGSLLSMALALSQLGKDTYMFMSEREFPMPDEYRFLDLSQIQPKLPEDLDRRTVVFLDCGNIERMPIEELNSGHCKLINIDHHHDNTLFGDVNLVVKRASSTAEIVYALFKQLGVELNAEIALALYVALITDTGKFMYQNTTPHCHRMAAELMEHGVDVQTVFKKLYEDIPFAKLTLLTRVLARAEMYDDGALIMAQLLREDYDYAGAEASFSEGIIDHIRAVRGTKVAALVRELLGGEGRVKVSLRAADESVDVSVIARAASGGGHTRAAGFTTDMSSDKIIQFIRDQVQKQLVADS